MRLAGLELMKVGLLRAVALTVALCGSIFAKPAAALTVNTSGMLLTSGVA